MPSPAARSAGSARSLDELRAELRTHYLADEAETVARLAAATGLTDEQRRSISANAVRLVEKVRKSADPQLMEVFLSEYGLSTTEGVALMCLAEALLRVPDAETMDDLIRDKIAPHDWSAHSGESTSIFVNASTWALMLTGRVLEEGEGTIERTLRNMIRRLGEPVIRKAVAAAMREMGEQFVLGRTIGEALRRGRPLLAKGYSYSYDMLGEAARTEADALRYHKAYADAIAALKPSATSDDIRRNPGISVKLSAIHPRYEATQKKGMLPAMGARLLALAEAAKEARMGLNIDAEEADRLDLSLDVIEEVLASPSLAGWDGFGVVVQAYGRRAPFVLDWLSALAEKLDRRIMVRLVKGAYWDTEIKRAQAMGLAGYPVFTRKANTDVSYLACARKLLSMTDRIYPQFATHNAHTVAAVLELAGADRDRFEFQRLHGMGEALHEAVRKTEGTRCRIYAPVGAHEDLLAYLVRRLLENGANSSFVHQIVDKSVSPEAIARDPLAIVEEQGPAANPAIPAPGAIFEPVRGNSAGWDITDPVILAAIDTARKKFAAPHRWHAAPMTRARGEGAGLSHVAKSPPLRRALRDTSPPNGGRGRAPSLAAGVSSPPSIGGEVVGEADRSGGRTSKPAAPGNRAPRPVFNPANPSEIVGEVVEADAAQVREAVGLAVAAQPEWAARPVGERAAILLRLADLYEENAVEFFALAAREAGKTLADGVAEVREAVDFLRYYAGQAEVAETGTVARGVIACISPWNFPLAIFTGQIAAALVTGNAVIAKPAEQTPLIAARAVELMRQAGVPEDVIQLLPGDGPSVGAPLTADPRIAGVCFTGSTEVAKGIEKQLAETAAPDAMLIAETGGLNAMIVDSTALPEQVVRDVIASAFQSAGQRCSALRVLYLQDDVAPKMTKMLAGALAALNVGDPSDIETDVGPVIDDEARTSISAYNEKMEKEGRLVAKLDAPSGGRFVGPGIFRVSGIGDMEREIFGPVLHLATYEPEKIDGVIADINGKGYGLTFGLHTRIDARVQHVVDAVHAGNIYVNRNQIGAVVGSQPFGGEGLSGTGPKAGGSNYLRRFRKAAGGSAAVAASTVTAIPASELAARFPSDAGGKWAARDDRIAVLRKLLRGKAAAAMAATAAAEYGPVDLPGPTGEANTLVTAPRGRVLCLGPDAEALLGEVVQALAAGNAVLAVAPDAAKALAPLTGKGLPLAAMDGRIDPAALRELPVDLVAFAGDASILRKLRQALASRAGPIVGVVSEKINPMAYVHERAICVDTTAAGGNASLLAAS